MFNGDDSWSFAASDHDIDEQLNAMEGEPFTNLSEESLRTLVRSFTETLQQKRSHLDLLYNLKDIENKDGLVQDIQNGIQSLEQKMFKLGIRKSENRKEHQTRQIYLPES